MLFIDNDKILWFFGCSFQQSHILHNRKLWEIAGEAFLFKNATLCKLLSRKKQKQNIDLQLVPVVLFLINSCLDDLTVLMYRSIQRTEFINKTLGFKS